METQFLTWLKARKEAPYAYAKRLGHGMHSVQRLAGVAREPSKRGIVFDSKFIEKISRDTGIPAGTLYEEALLAAKKPTPPRAYRRRIPEEDTRGTKADER